MLFLQPERGWELDLEDLASKIDDNTAAFFLNNPSNPCGCVYSRKHLLDILALCERYKLPIISDEIYDGMVSIYLSLTKEGQWSVHLTLGSNRAG